MKEIPKAPFVPGAPGTRRRPEHCRWQIPTQEERITIHRMTGMGSVRGDWSTVDPRGDLLYVGQTTCLLNRMHPRTHAMWTAIEGHRENVKIAVWAVPPAHLDRVEGWLTKLGEPLWSNGGSEIGDYAWREPDAVVPVDEFHPYRRTGQPCKPKTPAVYAWLVLPKGGVREVMLGGAERRHSIKAQHEPWPPPLPVTPADEAELQRVYDSKWLKELIRSVNEAERLDNPDDPRRVAAPKPNYRLPPGPVGGYPKGGRPVKKRS